MRDSEQAGQIYVKDVKKGGHCNRTAGLLQLTKIKTIKEICYLK